MKLRSWLPNCSTTTTASNSLRNSSYSDNSTSTTSSSTSASSSSTIQTNLSLLTLPSVPSLQKFTLSPDHSTPPATATLLAAVKPHRPGHIHFLAVHNNLLYAASGNEINIYETITNTLFSTIETFSTGSVKSIGFSGGKIFTAHQDCKIRVWKLNIEKQHKLIATLPTLEDRLRRFILPKNYVAVRRHRKKLWIEHHDAVSGLSSHENLVYSVSWDRSVKIWKSESLKCSESINKAHDDAINAVVLSSDGLIYTGSADKRVRVWRKEEKKYELVASLEKHKSAVNALALSSDGSVLFSGSCDRSILVWEREDSANHMVVTGALRGHGKAILCLTNVKDLLLSGSADRTVRVWRRRVDGAFSCLSVLDGHQTPVRSLAAMEAEDGGGVKVFSGSFDGEIRIWQVEVSNGKCNYS